MMYPIQTFQSKINIQTTEMLIEKLYYCIHDEKLFLFYKDKDLLLNCFEINEPSLISKIKKIKDKNYIDEILEEYIRTNLNIK